MKKPCNYCDPKNTTVYGFCKNCRRKCDCPLYDSKSGLSIEEYEEYKRIWNSPRLDIALDVLERDED